MILEIIAFAIVCLWSGLILLIFLSINNYIKRKRNNKEIITRTPLNSTINELYKQKRKK